MIEDAALLASTIDDLDSDAAAKARRFGCVTSRAQSWCDGLTAFFETGTAEEIARALEEITGCRNVGSTADAFSASSLLAGTLCEYAVVHKGVAFPDEALTPPRGATDERIEPRRRDRGPDGEARRRVAWHEPAPAADVHVGADAGLLGLPGAPKASTWPSFRLPSPEPLDAR